MIAQKHILYGHYAPPTTGPDGPASLLVDSTDDLDAHIAFWKERPLVFIELFNKELFYRANRFVKKSRAIYVMEKICTPEIMTSLRNLRRGMEALCPHPLRYTIVAEDKLLPIANLIINYQLEFLERLYVATAQKGSSLFHNTWVDHDKFFVEYYIPEKHRKRTTSLIVRHQGDVQARPLSVTEAAWVCQFFSQDAISNDALIERGMLLLRNHLLARYMAISDLNDEVFSDLYAAFMGVEGFETMSYLTSTSKS
jgi:hypothetical protein